MAEIRSQKVELSECRSLGSNQHQSGRSAKVSIGITVEKSPRFTTVVSGVRKENAPALHSPEKHSSGKGRVVGNKSRPHGVVDSETSNVELKEQTTSECLLSRSSGCKTSNNVAGKFYVNQMSTHKKVDELASEHNSEEIGLTFATMQKKNILDHEICKEPLGEVDKNTSDGLKMKLWEILGGGPSQKEQNMNSSGLDDNKENNGLNNYIGLLKDGVARFKYCSDPIETDSDSPNQTVRRPATRSMTRKMTPNKVEKILDDALNSEKKPLSPTFLDHKQKAKENLKGLDNEKKYFLSCRKKNQKILNQMAYGKSEAHIEFGKSIRPSSDNGPNVQPNFKSANDEENIFSFAEVLVEKNRTSEKSANTHSKRFNKKENIIIKMKTLNLPSGSSSKSTLQKVETEKLFLSPAKGLRQIETSPNLDQPSKKQSMQQKNVPNDSQDSQTNRQSPLGIPLVPKVVSYETDQSSLPENIKGSREYLNSPQMPKFTFQCDKAACSPVTSISDAPDDLHSPTFAGNATPSTPSRPSNDVADSPLQRRNINFNWNFHNSDNIVNDKPESCGSESNTESSDDIGNIYESHGLESTFEVGSETKEQMSLSPISKQDSDSSGAKELKIKEVRQRSNWVPSVDNSAKSPLKLHKRRRDHGLKGTKLSERDEINDLHEVSGQSIEGSLARAVNQLALALRRIKSKIRSHTNKKSCEILAAVADKIKLQLKDIDSQMQEDMVKFTGTSKAKRKRLESRLEEHQERMRLTHDKFKEEVNHHLLNCSSTLEELEAQNFEMKGTADRQKVLHRKLLLQIEEAMKDQLSAAEMSIVAVRKDAEKKFNNLKFALKEWLDEGGAIN